MREVQHSRTAVVAIGVILGALFGWWFIGATSASATEPETTVRSWVLPDGGTESNVTWDQPAYDPAAPITCGTTITIQHDLYPYATDEDKAKVASFTSPEGPGGVKLARGEDWSFVLDWWFTTVDGPACEPEPSQPPVEPSQPPVEPSQPPVAPETPTQPQEPVTTEILDVAEPTPAPQRAMLASTGPRTDGAIAGAVLVLAGTGLVLLRRRGATR